MSLEKIIKTLTTLGLSRLESEVYVYVAKKEINNLDDLVIGLEHTESEIVKSLTTLIKLGLVIEKGKNFEAIVFEKALELLINKHRNDESFLRTLGKT